MEKKCIHAYEFNRFPEDGGHTKRYMAHTLFMTLHRLYGLHFKNSNKKKKTPGNLCELHLVQARGILKNYSPARTWWVRSGPFGFWQRIKALIGFEYFRFVACFCISLCICLLSCIYCAFLYLIVFCIRHTFTLVMCWVCFARFCIWLCFLLSHVCIYIRSVKLHKVEVVKYCTCTSKLPSITILE